MSKVMIVSLKEKSYTQTPQIMSWDEYQEFCKKVSGEGLTWKAVLI
uniref:Uncharacterized protein n=2 Tax=unclassified bacterial viruses TaxID=12333 RepID=A0AAU6VZL3_9VIRU